MKTLNKILIWFNGKKRSIGIAGLAFLNLHIAEQNIPPDIIELLTWIFSIIGGVGILHADAKSNKSIIKRIDSNIKKVINKKN